MKSGGEGEGVTEAVAGNGLKKGPWTAVEDAILIKYLKKHGEGNWNSVQRKSGLSRCGKSCRLRWANHLRPNLKKGSFSPEEELLIIRLHAQIGNKWARMAAQLPGRTDNEIKNYWNTRIKRRMKAGLPLYPPEIQRKLQQKHQYQQGGAAAVVEGRSPYSSPASTPPTRPSSTSSDPTSGIFPTSPTPESRFSFSTSASATTTPLLPHFPLMGSVPLHQHRQQNPRFSPPVSTTPPASTFRFNFYNQYQHYNVNPVVSQLVTETAPLLQPSPAMSLFSSVKMELPSSQLSSEPLDSVHSSNNNHSNNSGLLDALVMESHGIRGPNIGSTMQSPSPAGDGEVKHLSIGIGNEIDGNNPPNHCFDHNLNKWDELGSSFVEPKKETGDKADSIRKEISKPPDMIPTHSSDNGGVSKWYNIDNGDFSNGGQPSGGGNGLELQQMAPYTSKMTVTGPLVPCSWDNLGIC